VFDSYGTSCAADSLQRQECTWAMDGDISTPMAALCDVESGHGPGQVLRSCDLSGSDSGCGVHGGAKQDYAALWHKTRQWPRALNGQWAFASTCPRLNSSIRPPIAPSPPSTDHIQLLLPVPRRHRHCRSSFLVEPGGVVYEVHRLHHRAVYNGTHSSSAPYRALRETPLPSATSNSFTSHELVALRTLGRRDAASSRTAPLTRKEFAAAVARLVDGDDEDGQYALRLFPDLARKARLGSRTLSLLERGADSYDREDRMLGTTRKRRFYAHHAAHVLFGRTCTVCVGLSGSGGTGTYAPVSDDDAVLAYTLNSRSVVTGCGEGMSSKMRLHGGAMRLASGRGNVRTLVDVLLRCWRERDAMAAVTFTVRDVNNVRLAGAAWATNERADAEHTLLLADVEDVETDLSSNDPARLPVVRDCAPLSFDVLPLVRVGDQLIRCGLHRLPVPPDSEAAAAAALLGVLAARRHPQTNVTVIVGAAAER
jgi:hypothetical protein